jgi:divinyl protochlorophyllide a 8-vinyl-reductase
MSLSAITSIEADVASVGFDLAVACIGPNAVLQLTEALRARDLGGLIGPLLRRAGVPEWLSEPPREMVDERAVGRLHRATRSVLPAREARAVMEEAGRRTADYLLANRIPRPAQMLLKRLPPSLAADVLIRAIRANAWTFAGSSRFVASGGRPVVFTLSGNPLCHGERAGIRVCHWHRAVFQRLFEQLVCSRARATETHCEAAGDAACRFEVDW